jgi:hypothetical protein
VNSLAYAGYILVLIGGVLLIIFGLLGLVNIVLIPLSPLFYLGVAAHGLITLIIGIIGILGSKYVERLEWAIILLILGIVAAGVGGALLVLGALLGLLSTLIKPHKFAF